MEDKLARYLLENNILSRQLSLEDRVSLLEKLETTAFTGTDQTIKTNSTEGDGGCCVFYPVPAVFNGQAVGVVVANGLITHDPVAGVLYATGFTSPPQWTQMNGGLTSTQYQGVSKILVVEVTGEIYVMRNVSGSTTFLAYSPGIGQPFTVLEDFASISAKYAGSTDNLLVAAVGCDPLTGLVVYALSQAGENIKLYGGSAGTFTARATFVLNTNNRADISFGGDDDDLLWMFTAGGGAKILSEDASSVVRTESVGPFYCSRHLRLGITGTTIHWTDDSLITGRALAIGTGNLTSLVSNVGYGLEAAEIYNDRIASDLTGQQLMARNGDFEPVKSDDGGETWDVISSLPTSVSWFYIYLSGAGASSSWIAAGGIYLYHSEDFGDTWTDITGDLTDFSATPSLDVIKTFSAFEKICIDLPNQPPSLVLSLSATDALSVHVEAGVIQTLTGYSWIPTTDPDISVADHIPETGVLFVGIQADASGTITLVDGDLHNSTETPDVSWLPLPETGNVMLGWVLLYAGTEYLCDIDLVVIAPYPVNYAALEMGAQIHAAEEITTLSDADEIGVWNSLTGLLAKITFENLLAQLTGIFNLLYAAIGHTHEDSSVGHLHGLARWVADGSTTNFDLPDYAAYVEAVSDDGIESDATIYSLSTDGTQVIYDSPPTAAHVIQAHYVIASV